MAAQFGNHAGAFAGRPATPPATHSAKINIEPEPAFWFIAHPNRWQFLDGQWLPVLSRLSQRPGAKNVTKDGDTAHAETLLRKGGWTVIPWDAVDGGYVTVYDGNRGPVHVSKWEQPRQVGAQVVMTTDQEGYRAFLRGLITDGYIAPPDPLVLEAMIEQQSQRVENNANRLHEPTVRARYERDLAKLEAMRAAAAPEAPATGRRGGRRG